MPVPPAFVVFQRGPRAAISTTAPTTVPPMAGKNPNQAHSIAKATMSAAMGKALSRRSMALPSVALWLEAEAAVELDLERGHDLVFIEVIDDLASEPTVL